MCKSAKNSKSPKSWLDEVSQVSQKPGNQSNGLWDPMEHLGNARKVSTTCAELVIAREDAGKQNVITKLRKCKKM